MMSFTLKKTLGFVKFDELLKKKKISTCKGTNNNWLQQMNNNFMKI